MLYYTDFEQYCEKKEEIESNILQLCVCGGIVE